LIRELPCSMSAISLLKRNGPDAVLKHWLALNIDAPVRRKSAMLFESHYPDSVRTFNTYFYVGRA
jgi:hypothetical protein